MINLLDRLQEITTTKDEEGFTTAELVGNAALGIIALLAIWLLITQGGEDLVGTIFDRLNENL